MAFTKKIWGFVAASVVTVPGIIGERPQKGEKAALEVSNRAANVCCLKSIQTEKKEFSAKESEFDYPSTYSTKYTFYEGLITAKMMNEENFDPEATCDMTALMGDVGRADARTKCKDKMKSLPAYWKKVGEWDNQNRKLLGQDAAAHMQFTIGEQQKVVKANNADHMKTFNDDKAASVKSISEAIKSSQADYFAIIETMKQKLTELQHGIVADLQKVQKAAEFELDKAQGLVYPSTTQRLNYLTEISQKFNLEAGAAPEQDQVYPPHDESAFQVTDIPDATTAYGNIKNEVQKIMDNLIKESQLENIQTGVDALKPRVLDEVKAFLTRSDASLKDQEEKINKEQVKWVKTVNTAKAMITKMDTKIGEIEAMQEAKQTEISANHPGQATSRAASNCAFPEGQDKLSEMDYCCCKMKPEGVAEGLWSWVPKKFEDWTSCAETKKMTKDAANYALQAVSLGFADTGSCTYFSLCESCSNLDGEGKMLFDPTKKRASLQMNQHADLLAEYKLEFSRASTDKDHFYAKCPGSENELKISLDVNECNGVQACLDNPTAGFVVPDKCCAHSASSYQCACLMYSNCRCKYSRPLSPCSP